MSTTMVMKSPLPSQQFDTVKSDENGLCVVAAGSDLAKGMISCGWQVITALPTVDPHVAGAIWNNGGTIAISAGG
jgi:hypothetical protein